MSNGYQPKQAPNITFTPATDVLKTLKLKMSIQGISGSGKTFTALTIAKGLGGRTAVVDTEKGKSALYKSVFDFDILQLNSHQPKFYLQAIDAAVKAGYNTLIIDSLSHLWMGEDGILDLVETLTAQYKGMSMQAWAKATPMLREVFDAIISADIHIISCMRAKKEYVISKDDKGKTKIDVVGMAAVQKEGIEFEFDLNCEMDKEHNLIVMKTRFVNMHQIVYPKPTEEFAHLITSFLGTNNVVESTSEQVAQQPAPVFVEPVVAPTPIVEFVDEETYKKLWAELQDHGFTTEAVKQKLAEYDVVSLKQIPVTLYDTIRNAFFNEVLGEEMP